MNNEQTILICPRASRLPEITMHRINSASENDFHYEITADEDGRIREIHGEFGKDIKTAARILLRTLLRLDINPDKALDAAREFYLAARRNIFLARIKDQASAGPTGNSSSSF